jgi:hypothetical protein
MQTINEILYNLVGLNIGINSDSELTTIEKPILDYFDIKGVSNATLSDLVCNNVISLDNLVNIAKENNVLLTDNNINIRFKKSYISDISVQKNLLANKKIFASRFIELEINYLLQENGFYLLQENGYKIIL